jgi:translation initiation factor IF-2
MNEAKDKDKEKKGTLSLGGTLSLKGSSSGSSSVRQNLPSGRSAGPKTVAVEVRRRRTTSSATAKDSTSPESSEEIKDTRSLTTQEREARIRALKEAEELEKRKKIEAKEQAERDAIESQREKEERERRKKELEELKQIQKEEEEKKEKELAKVQDASVPPPSDQPVQKPQQDRKKFLDADEEEEESYRSRMKRQAQRRPSRNTDNRRRGGKLTVTQALSEDYERDRGPSLAAQKRALEKARMAAKSPNEPPKKQSREVIVPEVITVQELANRMAERSGDVIKSLMKMGVMATINQSIDADTAELIIDEFGHKIKRVTEADVEIGIEGEEDTTESLKSRPPVVTVMGHVDHGKTSLLDALRQTDVVSGEAGGITQHIGAYQVTMKSGDKITFLDTPGHAAFTEMRARGANVTDIVVLVVAANDSIMPQTIEAINHAKAANVPLIIAINKVDLPSTDIKKVKNDLLQHEVILEEMGGETLSVEVSAKQHLNLDKLEEAILLQAEMLDLKANPDRSAVGAVIEAKLEQGRGNVATILIQKGTLNIGDIFVVGKEWGRVRALINDKGENIETAIPGQPIEVLGLNGSPESGDQFVVVSSEARAREISSYRQRKMRDSSNLLHSTGASFDQLLAAAKDAELQALSIIIKGDVHGSVEAIIGSLDKMVSENEDVRINVLHSGVGGITESDVTLANASNALIVGFNVRANAQARALAEKEQVDLRYYNVIYDVVDDAKNILSGMLAPIIREEYLGQASIKQVFRITKVGNVAGCMITAGMVKRGAKVRLLRDDIVIHEGTLKTLKRHQDEVKEVKEGTECGMAFENYDDIKEGDVIECFDIVEEQRTIE